MSKLAVRHGVNSVESVLEALLGMAVQVENSVRQSLYALRETSPQEAGQVFLRESRINEMEVEIDEQVVRLLAAGPLEPSELRLLIATLRVTNDLERLGDLALNVAGCVVALQEHRPFAVPLELKQMADATEAMICDSLQALQSRRTELAQQVLEADDNVDGYADSLVRLLSADMERDSRGVPRNVQLLLTTRHLERMADHATNIGEDVIFWLRGLDVRHHLQRPQF